MEFEIRYDMVKKVENYCLENKLFAEGDGIVLGVSGGADSIFLLAFFYMIREAWKLKLQVVHVNHGIRGDAAGADEEYVRKLADTLGLPFKSYQADIPFLAGKWKMTEEEAGRYYRYQCFEEIRKEHGYASIAVAHHMNDQAETVLFQLFRGSGLRGLGGIYPKKGRIIRPLLALSKKEILETLRECGIKYCEDVTNRENGYSRNFIRNELFPLAEKKFQKKIQEHIAASASYLRDVMSYIEFQTENVFQNHVKKETKSCRIERKDFLACHMALQRELIFRMIRELTGKTKDITGTHIEQVRTVFLGETGKYTPLPYQLLAKREYENLYLEISMENPMEKEEEVFFEKKLQPDEIYEIFYTNGEKRYFQTKIRKISGISERNLKKYCTKCFDYDKIKPETLFRYPLAGDYFWLDRSGRRKKLSRFFIDEKIPAEQRKHMVVLAEGNHVLWIPELGRCSAFYYLSEESKRMFCIEEISIK